MKGRVFLIILVAVALLALLLLPAPATRPAKRATRDIVAPFQDACARVTDGARNALVYFGDSIRAAEDQQRLRNEITQLRNEVIRLEVLRQDNDELRRVLGFRRQSQRRLLPAMVVARNEMTGWWQTLQLNVGSRAGVTTDRAVVTAEGLIGKTVAVSAQTTDVLLITDPACRVACRLARTGELGILQGQGVSLGSRDKMELLYAPNPCRMEYIPKAAVVNPDDEVVTSGLGGIFPPGLLVGRVLRASPDASGLYMRAYLTPAAAVSDIRYVCVVLE